VRFEDIAPERVNADFLPNLAVRSLHARHFPDMASVVDPHALVTTIVAAAERRGAIRTEASVSAIEPMSGRPSRVLTSAGAIPCAGVLVCAGADSARLIEPLGYRIPLARERGYHVELDKRGADDIRLPVTFVERGFVCTPMRSVIRLAGTVELGGAREPDWRRAALLTQHFQALFKSPVARELSRWSGDRPTLPDYLPMIGALPGHRNVFVATGHQHLGLTMAAITAELIRALVGGQPAALDLAPFRIERFSSSFLSSSKTHERPLPANS
jgi:glycine/D-amino acid oxidase-like deaminating enzyme